MARLSDLGDWLHSELVYVPDSYRSFYGLRIYGNFVDSRVVGLESWTWTQVGLESDFLRTWTGLGLEGQGLGLGLGLEG